MLKNKKNKKRSVPCFMCFEALKVIFLKTLAVFDARKNIKLNFLAASAQY